MRFFNQVFLLLFLTLFSLNSFAGNGSSNVSSVYGYGVSQAGNSGPTISSSDVTKWYTASCNFENSNTTASNYYKCAKQGSTATGDWKVANGKTAYCQGFYFQTNVLSGSSSNWFNFGYGTAAVTQNSSSAPSGSVIYGTTNPNPVASFGGSNVAYGQVQWIAMPVFFPASGADIYPYMFAGQSSSTLGVNLICTDQ